MSKRPSIHRFLLPLILVAAPRLHAQAPSPEQLLDLLNSGVPDAEVAELAGCPDVASLHDFVLGPVESFVRISAGFADTGGGIESRLPTPLPAERNGFQASPSWLSALTPRVGTGWIDRGELGSSMMRPLGTMADPRDRFDRLGPADPLLLAPDLFR